MGQLIPGRARQENQVLLGADVDAIVVVDERARRYRDAAAQRVVDEIDAAFAEESRSRLAGVSPLFVRPRDSEPELFR